jgi:hypothetical protein
MLGCNQIRFDEIRALFDSSLVGLDRMFRQIATCAAMTYDERLAAVERRKRFRIVIIATTARCHYAGCNQRYAPN